MSDGNNSNNNAYFDFSREGQTMEDLFDTLAALDEEYQLGGRLLAALDKDKLDGIEEDAEVNKIAAIFVGDTELTPSNKVVTFQTDSEPTYGSVKLVLSGDLYNKFVQYYTKSQVDSMIAALHQFVPVVADSLPEASADTMYLLYLIPSTNPKTRNAKDEFITIRSGSEGSYTYAWEQIGTTTIDIDGKEDKTNKVTSFSNPTDTQYPSAKLVSDSLDKVKDDVSSLLSRAGIAEGIADTISAGTAQEFLQRQSGGDGVNCIKRIKGKTIAWNQLVQNGDFSNGTTGWSVYSGTGSVSGGVLTVTDAVGRNGVKLSTSLSLVSNHKYFYHFYCKTSVELAFYLVINNVKVPPTDSFVKVSGISQPQTSGHFGDFYPNVAGETGTFSLKDVRVTDLTAMFGAGNEPSTVAEFEALYPALYYAYNAGVLKSNDAAAFLTNGRNQWDEKWKKATISQSDGETFTADSSILSSANKIKVIAGESYYIKTANPYRYFFYDESGAFLSTDSAMAGTLLAIPAGVGYIRFQTSYTGDYTYDICINLSDASFNGTYEPYWQRVLALRLSELTGIPEGGTEADRVTMFPNGPGGAGSAFDSIFVENEVTKARGTMKRVNLGDLDYSEYSAPERHIFRVNTDSIPGFKIAASNSSLLNAISAKYQQLTFQAITSSDNMCFACSDSVSKRLVFINHAYTDAAAFKAAMDGVYLEYELATPIVYTDLQYADGTPFTMPATILVDDYGTERIQAPEGATTPSAPFCCDSNYSISIANLVKKLNSNE